MVVTVHFTFVIGFPLNIQYTSGAGLPPASHDKTTLSPSLAVVISGTSMFGVKYNLASLSMGEASENKNNGKQVIKIVICKIVLVFSEIMVFNDLFKSFEQEETIQDIGT